MALFHLAWNLHLPSRLIKHFYDKGNQAEATHIAAIQLECVEVVLAINRALKPQSDSS